MVEYKNSFAHMLIENRTSKFSTETLSYRADRYIAEAMDIAKQQGTTQGTAWIPIVYYNSLPKDKQQQLVDIMKYKLMEQHFWVNSHRTKPGVNFQASLNEVCLKEGTHNEKY